MIAIRKATPSDCDQIWNIIKQVIAGGDIIAFSPDSSKEKMLGFWCGPDKHTYSLIFFGEVNFSDFLINN